MSYYGRLNTGLQVNGSISPLGDVDQYQTAFIKGLTYTVTAYGADTGSGTLVDPHMSLTDMAGNTLAYNDDISATNRNAQITFTAGATGDYLVNVAENGGNATGTYVYQISVGYASNYADQVNGTMYGDAIAGMDGNDVLWGGNGNDYLYGQNGNDQLAGNADADYLNGGFGWDTMRGGAGNDTLVGGAGRDQLMGGQGADRFVFTNVGDSNMTNWDTIVAGDGAVAFEGVGVAGGDVIDVSQIDANPYAAGNQAFVFSTQAGTGTAALWTDSAGNTVLGLSSDADADYEFIVRIADGAVNPQQYAASDFVL